MFITPNSTVEIMRGIRLDKEHNHTAYFQNETAQDVWYYNWVENEGFRLTNYTFLKEDGTINVQIDLTAGLTYTAISRCNYMRFKNTSYYNKWFYAFIDKVELMNNRCAKIYFTLDVMQTWLYGVDYTVLPTMVEREHTSYDAIGANILPEPIRDGELVYGWADFPLIYRPNGAQYTLNLNNLALIVAISCQVNFTQNQDGSWNATIVPQLTETTYFGKNNVSSLNYLKFTNTTEGIRKFAALMDEIQQEGIVDTVFSIFWFPSIFHQTTGDIPSHGAWSDFGKDYSIENVMVENHSFQNLDGYVPKNKKMFTYPYYRFTLITQNGCTDYPFEYFENKIPTFNVYGAVSPAATVKIFPAHYKKANSNYIPKWSTLDDSIEIGGYPTVPYNNDLAAAYYAQWNAGMSFRKGRWGLDTAAQTVISAAQTAIPTPLNIAKNAVIGFEKSVASVSDEIAKSGEEMAAKSVAPIRTEGTATDVTLLQAGGFGVVATYRCLRYDLAKMVDDYFTQYGYACREIKTVSVRNRTHYTYVKTIGANIEVDEGTGMPHDYEEEICNCFNKGITYWVDPSEIGDYSVTNDPISGYGS